MKRVEFSAQITLGNVLQILTGIGAVTAFLIANEHRLSVIESEQKTQKDRLARMESIVERTAEQLALVANNRTH